MGAYKPFFIIGGGKRSSHLIQTMLRNANLTDKDYIAVLPMESSIPDTVTNTIKNQIESIGDFNILIFNFKNKKDQNKKWVDSLKNVQIIYITGGDQNKFMKLVLNTPYFSPLFKP